MQVLIQNFLFARMVSYQCEKLNIKILHWGGSLLREDFHYIQRRLVAEPAAALDLILPSDLELKEP